MASTILYHQLYSAEDNNHKEEQLYSANAKDDDDDDNNDDDDDDDNDDDNNDDDDDDDDDDDNDDDNNDDDMTTTTTTTMTTTKTLRTTSVFTRLLTTNTTTNDKEDYVGIHKHIDNDYDDILDMDIDSEEEFRSSFLKNQNSSKLRVKGGDQRPDVSDLSEKEAEEVLNKWRKKRKAFTDKIKPDRRQSRSRDEEV